MSAEPSTNLPPVGSLAASCLWHGDVCLLRNELRVFCALGDGITPFRVSMVSIFSTQCLPMFCTNFRRTGFSSGNRGSEFGLDAFVILAAGSQANGLPWQH